MKRYASVFVILGVVALAMVACSDSKSKDEQATDLLNQALQQHVDGKFDEAAATYRKVLAKDPQNKFAFYNLGLIDQTQDKMQSAENNYRLSLNVDPDYAPALFNLAIVRAQAGDTAQAIQLYRHVVSVNANEAGAHLNLGLLLRQTGQAAEGDAEVTQAIQLDPSLAQRSGATAPSANSPTPGATPGPVTTVSAATSATPPR